MPFPKTEQQLTNQGYIYQNSSQCSGPNCRRSVDWWTTPNGRKMPFDDNGDGTVTPHHASCPDADRFRRGRRRR